jgi:DNA-binding CsgD family transcriptional regulator
MSALLREEPDPALVDAVFARSAGEMLVRRAAGFRHDPFEPAAASVPECGPTALLCRAELSRLRGASDPEPWASTAAAWDALGRPYPAGYARLRAAEAMLQSEGSLQQAKAMLRAAYRTACELGTEPLRCECAQVARWHRIDLSALSDLVPEQMAARSDAGPAAGLTAREREILALVAAGCTNREIANALVISPKTASVHVSNILRKLGMSGRGNAARVGHRLGLVPADRLQR